MSYPCPRLLLGCTCPLCQATDIRSGFPNWRAYAPGQHAQHAAMVADLIDEAQRILEDNA